MYYSLPKAEWLVHDLIPSTNVLVTGIIIKHTKRPSIKIQPYLIKPKCVVLLKKL